MHSVYCHLLLCVCFDMQVQRLRTVRLFTHGSLVSQVPLSDIICQQHLTLFRHVACTDTHIDTRCLLTAAVLDAWQRLSGRSRQSWLSNILSDLSQLNLFFSEVIDQASIFLEWKNLVCQCKMLCSRACC